MKPSTTTIRRGVLCAAAGRNLGTSSLLRSGGELARAKMAGFLGNPVTDSGSFLRGRGAITAGMYAIGTEDRRGLSFMTALLEGLCICLPNLFGVRLCGDCGTQSAILGLLLEFLITLCSGKSTAGVLRSIGLERASSDSEYVSGVWAGDLSRGA